MGRKQVNQLIQKLKKMDENVIITDVRCVDPRSM